jgi:RNA polymerase sigma-70 factor (ECF subfamily)
MGTSSDDFSLINDCISGGEEAWHAFIDRFSQLVYYSIHKAVKPYSADLDQEDIEDIYNGVFLSFIENNYKKLRQFEGKKGCTLSSWVRLIAIRHTIDFLRKQRQHIATDDESYTARPMHETLQDNAPSVLDHMEMSETKKIMKKAIDTLPSSDRLFMELYYKKELSPEEIARIMNVSVGTVYSKKNRIREKILKILQSRGFIA